MLIKTDATMNELLIRSGSRDKSVAVAAQIELAVALTTPLKQAVLEGDNLGNIFEMREFGPGESVEYPLDFITVSNEKEHVAYAAPNHGRIPERTVEGDFIMVPTFDIASAIDMLLKYARDARWDVVGRALDVLDASLIKKINDDGWHVILSAAFDRNVLVFDAAATASRFTKRLISLLKTEMRRRGGGNMGSTGRAEVTDLFMSLEGLEDVRDWTNTEVDEVTRRQIYTAPDGGINNIYGVNLHPMDEFGSGYEYQNYFVNTLGGSIQGSDTELVIGLDLKNRDSFVMPIREMPTVNPDEALHRSRKMGFYTWMEYGMACLNNVRVITGSF